MTNRQGRFQNEKVTIVEETVPDSTCEVQLENIRKSGHNPLKKENATADSCIHENLMQFRKFFLHESHENMEYHVDLVHVKAVEIEKHVFTVHEIGKHGKSL